MRKKSLLCLLVLLAGSICFAAERPKPNRWDKKIAEIETKLAGKQADDVDVVFIGSSSIRMWDLATSFPDVAAVNCGFGGSHIADSTHYAERLVKPFAPKCVVLYAGDNDIKKGLSVEQVVDDYKACAAAFRKAAPSVRILYVAIKPSTSRWVLYSQMASANRKIKALTEADGNAEFIDIARPMLAGTDGPPADDLFVKDGLHLSKKGYAMWNNTIRDLLPKR